MSNPKFSKHVNCNKKTTLGYINKELLNFINVSPNEILNFMVRYPMATAVFQDLPKRLKISLKLKIIGAYQ